jgi:hypothetical protein
MRRHAPEAGSSFGPWRAQVRTPVFLVSATFLPRKCFQPPQYCCSLRHPAEKTEATTRHGYKREKNRMSMDFSCVWLPWFAGESRRIRQERMWYFQDNSPFIRLRKVMEDPNRVGVCSRSSWASSSISFPVRRDFLHCLPVDGGNCREYKTAQRAFQEVQLCTLEPPPSPPHPSHTSSMSCTQPARTAAGSSISRRPPCIPTAPRAATVRNVELRCLKPTWRTRPYRHITSGAAKCRRGRQGL